MVVKIRLKDVRTSRSISQNELARILEMSLANIQKIERNKAKSIPLDTLDRLCEVLNCEVGDLLVRVSDRELEALWVKTNSQNKSPLTIPLPAGDVQQWKKNMVGSCYGLSATKTIPFSSGIAFSMAKPNSQITWKKPRRINQWVENTWFFVPNGLKMKGQIIGF